MLHKQMARNSALRASIDRIAAENAARSAQLEAKIAMRLTQLRDRIRAAGIGNDPEAEQQYGQTIIQWHQLGHIAARTPEESPLNKATGDETDLLSFGCLLLDIFGDSHVPPERREIVRRCGETLV
ncbi:MAG: hypothetical protein AAFY11_10825, partial [Cyanobacteria bacterium J06641_5]